MSSLYITKIIIVSIINYIFARRAEPRAILYLNSCAICIAANGRPYANPWRASASHGLAEAEREKRGARPVPARITTVATAKRVRACYVLLPALDRLSQGWRRRSSSFDSRTKYPPYPLSSLIGGAMDGALFPVSGQLHVTFPACEVWASIGEPKSGRAE